MIRSVFCIRILHLVFHLLASLKHLVLSPLRNWWYASDTLMIRSAFCVKILHLVVHFFVSLIMITRGNARTPHTYTIWRMLSGLGISKCLTSDTLAPMRCASATLTDPARGAIYWWCPPRALALFINALQNWWYAKWCAQLVALESCIWWSICWLH